MFTVNAARLDAMGRRFELSNQTARKCFIENSHSVINDRLKYVHVNFGFYYKCAISGLNGMIKHVG